MTSNIVVQRLALAIFISGAFFPVFAGAASLTRSLDLGTSGSDVSDLQRFLSLDSTLYPSKLVTGYYGELTKAAIERFQTRNGIVSSGTPETTGYGRVGPATMAALNASMSGSPGPAVTTSAPIISNVTVTRDSTSATIAWSGNTPSIGRVYYQTTFPNLVEGSATARAQIGGTIVSDTGGLLEGHSVSITGLQPTTTYYYVVESVDGNGGQSLTWPATFRTQ